MSRRLSQAVLDSLSGHWRSPRRRPNLSNLGSDYHSLGKLQQAIGYYEQALALAREIGDQQSESELSADLGSAYHRLGKLSQAIGHYERYLAIPMEIEGLRVRKGHALGNLGGAYAGLGQIDCAIMCFEQHLALAREIRDVSGVARANINMAVALADQGQREVALPYARGYARARLFAQIGDVQMAQNAQQLFIDLRDSQNIKLAHSGRVPPGCG